MAAERAEGFPLSAQQRRLWSLWSGEPARLVAGCAIEVSGPLDEARLRAAVGAVVAAHEVLRSAFVRLPGSGEPVQVPRELAASWCADDDLSGLEMAAGAEALPQRFDKRIAALSAGIDPEAGPLVRCALVQLAADRHVLLLAVSALAADERSLVLLAAGIAQTYAGGEGPAEEEPLAYVDYVAWQRELLAEEEAERGRSFWRRLAPLPEVALPFTRRRATGAAFAPRRLAVPLSGALGGALVAVARRHGVGVADVELAAWAVLLWRLTGGESVVVGIGTAGRSVEDLRSAIGPFDRVLPLRLALGGGMPFTDLVAAVATAAREAAVAQEHFAWDLVSRGATVAFGFDWREEARLTAAGAVSFRVLHREVPGEPFAVCLVGEDRPDGPRLELVYDAGSVDEPAWLVPPLQALLASAVERPEAPLDELALMTPHERRQAFAVTSVAEALPGATAPGLFAAQAARTPEAVALVAGEEALTYAELAARAHRLAHWLSTQGVGPETRIAVCMERGFDLMTALLGVLASGAAFVPLDPSHPRGRLALLLADSGAPLVLTDEATSARLPAPVQPEARIVSLPGLGETLRAQPTHPPQVEVDPATLAYVMYTSGSTGKPKGVEIPHGGLASYLLFCARTYFTARRHGGVPVHSSLGFDLTLTSLLAPLVVGDRAILLPDDRSFESLVATLGHGGEPLSLVKLTPSHLRLLPPTAFARGIDVLVVGGEALAGEDLRALAERLPETRVVNEYGPTEAVVGCCVHELPARDAAAGPIPIGRPAPYARLHLLDRRLEPVPVGVPGELYVAGEGLARGYLGRADLSAERFLPEAGGAAPGARMYRTGDLARARPDGALEYLGRVDQQVKVRGFRVELAEVEAALAEHPAVARGAVVARDGGDEGKRLIAYYVPREGGPRPTVTDLAAALRARLPEFMVPAAFVELAALPLTANGKVDAAALPAPEAVRPKLAQVYVAPRTTLETAIAALWRDCLHLDAVGVDDSFFDLGGSSWLVLRVHARLEEALGRQVPVVALFAHPTIAALAAHLESAAAPELEITAAASPEVTAVASAAAAGARRRQAAERPRRRSAS